MSPCVSIILSSCHVYIILQPRPTAARSAPRRGPRALCRVRLRVRVRGARGGAHASHTTRALHPRFGKFASAAIDGISTGGSAPPARGSDQALVVTRGAVGVVPHATYRAAAEARRRGRASAASPLRSMTPSPSCAPRRAQPVVAAVVGWARPRPRGRLTSWPAVEDLGTPSGRCATRARRPAGGGVYSANSRAAVGIPSRSGVAGVAQGRQCVSHCSRTAGAPFACASAWSTASRGRAWARRKEMRDLLGHAL